MLLPSHSLLLSSHTMQATRPIVAVQIPAGVRPGGQFLALGPGGVQMMISNPGLPAGSIIHVRAPPPPVQQAAGAGPTPPAMQRKESKKVTQVETVKEEDIPKDEKIETAASFVARHAEATNEALLCPCLSLGCVSWSVYPMFPDCIGVYQKGTCCFIFEVEQLCCKVSKTDGVYCKLCNGTFEIVKPMSCCKMTETMCCFDARIAIPTDEETPAQLACCGFICCKSMKCQCAFYDSRAATSATTAKV